MQETQVRFLSREDPQEKETAIHYRILAWEIPWTEEPGKLQSMQGKRDTTQRLNNNKKTSSMYLYVFSKVLMCSNCSKNNVYMSVGK